MLFIRCEVRHDRGLKLMMRIGRVQNYKGNNAVWSSECDMMEKANFTKYF